MRIFLAGSFIEEHLTGWSVYRALIELGHDVLIYDYRINFFVNSKQKVILDLLLRLDKFNPNLVLILKGELFAKEILIAMNNYKIALWHFDFDNIAKRQIEEQCQYVDYLFTMCKPWHKLFLGKKGGYWLPQGHDPIMFYPVKQSIKKLNDIIFIGTLKPRREAFISKFIKAGLKVSIYGENWNYSTLKSYWRGPAYCRAFSQAIANCKIIVSTINGSGTKLESTTSQRIFRVCGCKGVYLTDFVPGINDFYEEGTEIFTYKGTGNAVSIAKKLLKNHFKRRAVAIRSYKRTMDEHLYVHRLRRLIACVS